MLSSWTSTATQIKHQCVTHCDCPHTLHHTPQVVGTLGVLFMPIPLLMKQCYMVWVGIIVAYIFTWIPDWTGWVLLVAMALYDIAAVLIPGGPLKVC